MLVTVHWVPSQCSSTKPLAQTSFELKAITAPSVPGTVALGSTIHVWPFQCSTRVIRLPLPSSCSPTAHTSSGARTETARRVLLGIAVFAVGTTDQRVPSQCSAKVLYPDPPKESDQPTAQASVAEKAATPDSWLASPDSWAGERLGTRCQALPQALDHALVVSAETGVTNRPRGIAARTKERPIKMRRL